MVAPVRSLDCLESAEPMCQQVECTAQGRRWEDEEGKTDETVEQEEEQRTGVDLVSDLDWSTTAPLVLSALQARPPGRNDPPWTT